MNYDIAVLPAEMKAFHSHVRLYGVSIVIIMKYNCRLSLAIYLRMSQTIWLRMAAAVSLTLRKLMCYEMYFTIECVKICDPIS